MKSKRFRSLLLCASSASLLFSHSAKAAEYWWDSNTTNAGFGNTTGTWGSSAFWNDNSSGGSGTFTTATTSSDTVNFGNASANYSNSAVGVALAGVTVNSIVYGAGQTTSINLGTAGNSITLAGTTPTITVNNTTVAQTISSNLLGSGGLIKAGNGNLFLSGTNTYSGGTTVSAGILSFRNTGSKSSGSGTHAFSSGTTLGLGVATTGSFFTATDVTNAFNGSMTGNLSNVSVAADTNIGIDTSNGAFIYATDIGSVTRGLVKLGTNNLTLSGNNAYTGRTILTGGSVIVTSFGNTGDSSSPLGTNSTVEFRTGGNLTFQGATVQSSDKTFDIARADATFRADGTGVGAITLTANINPTSTVNKTLKLFGGNTNDNTVSGNILNGAGGVLALEKNNTGTWVLSGNNTFTGSTSVSAGVLIIGHANALGSTTGATTVSNGATLGFRGGISTAAEAITLTPGTSGTAMLRNFSGNNTWSGTITSNTATATNVSRIGSDAGKLTLGGTVSITGSAHQLVLQGDGNIEITGQITGVGIVSSATNGVGVRKLANDTSNYTGQTRVNGGTLEFTSIANVGATASSLGAPLLADSVINLGFDTTDATMRYVGTATDGHTSDRVVRLNYTGTTTSNYAIQANGTGPLVLTSGVTAANGSKTLTLSGTSTAANSIGVIANGGSGVISVTKSGAGTWVLTGTNTYTGATTVSEGKFLINGSTATGSTVGVSADATLGGTGTIGGAVNVTGSLSPGASIETLATGTLSFANSSTLVHELNSSVSANVGSDLLKVTGDLNLTGTVGINFSDIALTDVAFDNGTVFSLINYTGAWNNGLFTLGGNELADEEQFTFGLNTWRISYNDAIGGLNYTSEYAGGTDSFVNITVVPEPRAALLGSLGLLAILRRRRA